MRIMIFAVLIGMCACGSDGYMSYRAYDGPGNMLGDTHKGSVKCFYGTGTGKLTATGTFSSGLECQTITVTYDRVAGTGQYAFGPTMLEGDGTCAAADGVTYEADFTGANPNLVGFGGGVFVSTFDVTTGGPPGVNSNIAAGFAFSAGATVAGATKDVGIQEGKFDCGGNINSL
jgi:hypothetical protein